MMRMMRIKRSIRRTWVLSVEEWFRFESDGIRRGGENLMKQQPSSSRLNTNESNICKDEDEENGEEERARHEGRASVF